ncbi:hypothetical protein [Rhizohabitans arisaemae]|uniref:hypothetical protein n=1 Tax=Rhizohabitans arisaemae TaxID=2720610 RepID=UPI0024B1CBC4|nr:hypothetical protein [Rhizohabitans arisaemae]
MAQRPRTAWQPGGRLIARLGGAPVQDTRAPPDSGSRSPGGHAGPALRPGGVGAPDDDPAVPGPVDRTACPPVVARAERGHVLLDLRTVFPDQDQGLLHGLTP